MGAGTVTATAAGVPGKARARGPSRQRGPAPWAKTSRRPCRGTRSRGCSGAARGARGRGSSELAFFKLFPIPFRGRARHLFFIASTRSLSLSFTPLFLSSFSLSLSLKILRQLRQGRPHDPRRLGRRRARLPRGRRQDQGRGGRKLPLSFPFVEGRGRHRRFPDPRGPHLPVLRLGEVRGAGPQEPRGADCFDFVRHEPADALALSAQDAALARGREARGRGWRGEGAGVVRGGAGARGGREEEGRGWGREREAGQRERVDFVKEPKENQHDFRFLEAFLFLCDDSHSRWGEKSSPQVAVKSSN